MLISLHIQNFVLIDQTTIEFKPGLNVLTGETGSGKSAIIDALNLVLGSRHDTDMIRNGQEKATVEAQFDISQASELPSLFEHMGLLYDPDFIHIKREMTRNGKNRIWINREPVPLIKLKSIASHLLEFVGQRATNILVEESNHLEILDDIGRLRPIRKQFKDVHLLLLRKEKELKNLKESKEAFAKQQTKVSEALKEIDAVSPCEGEEDALFDEYTILSNVEELKEGLLSILETLGSVGVLQALNLVKKRTEDFSKIDGSLQECVLMTKDAIANMKEVERFVEAKLSSLDSNTERVHYLENRLKAISRLKKIYGPTMNDVFLTWNRLKQDNISQDDQEESEIQLEEEIVKLDAMANALSRTLSVKRLDVGQFLSSNVTKTLKTLNMPNAQFSVIFTEKARSETGIDHVQFFLSPNLGENPVSVSQSASGGELSRVLLALKTMEESAISIVFDEIDANIGGNTAVMVGEKLKDLSLKKQVILITHFPQVAHFATHHIKISKKESFGRTFTEIEPLEESGRKLELVRMSGLNLL